jgi:2-polyprenyl-3-methyl-5-hydroxy-6-metoxy-1,4-benzoquinol methylase
MKCRICGNERDNKEYEVKEMMYGYRDAHLYFQCSECSCLQINKFPSDMSKYYRGAYYAHQPDQHNSNIKCFFIRLRNKYALSKRGLIGKFVFLKYPTTQFNYLQPIRATIRLDSRILDVGCGAGNHLKSLHEAGYTNLLGVDPFIENDIDYENGLIIKKQHIQEVQGNYDLIMFHHSFEHCPDPIDILQSVFALLVPGGHCVIRIPIASSYAWKCYGVNWAQLDAPRHLYLHSVESMEIISNKVGFELGDIIYDSTSFQFWGSEQYIKDIPLMDNRSLWVNPGSTLFSKEDIALFSERADELNSVRQGDQAIFYLRKSDKI